MNSVRRRFFIFLCLVGCLTIAPAQANSLTSLVQGLHILPIPYGVTPLTVTKDSLVITRARYGAETAAGGDIFMLMLKRETGWEAVPHADNGRDVGNIVFTSIPHTYDDSIQMIYFLLSENNNDLYVLDAERGIGSSLPKATPATLTLYRLERHDNNFNQRYLTKISIVKTKGRYSNIDCAVHQELGLPLADPDNANCS